MLRFRGIQIEVESEDGPFGLTEEFQDGLTVFRAENSAGKSTIVQSIIYALGLEGMLSAKRAIPLPHAMTHEIEDEDEIKHRVKGSVVKLEIENADKERVTILRQVVGPNKPNLVTVFFGGCISEARENSEVESEDFYVREPGAAKNEKGFHYWLTRFIGWELPTVPRFNDGDALLYLECVFPSMIVEQKKAWTGIQARVPTHYGIRDVAKRSIEFLLKLQVFETILERQRLKVRQNKLAESWGKKSLEVVAMARELNAIVSGLQDVPGANFTGFTLSISRNTDWISLEAELEVVKANYEELSKNDYSTVEELAPQVTEELDEQTELLAELTFAEQELRSEIAFDNGNLKNLDIRIQALVESERENKDTRKIRRMKSSKDISISASGRCPTCNTEIDDSLLPMADEAVPMSLDENIQFIESQLKLYRASKGSEEQMLTAKQARMSQLKERISEVRRRIRILKDTLQESNKSPAISEVEARVRLGDRIENLRRSLSRIEEFNDSLTKTAAKYLEVTEKLNELPKGGLSAKDEAKLKRLETLFQGHAKQFGVTSLEPSSITLSPTSYLPEHEGFNLEFDLSASDLIRTIWAYLHALLEFSRKGESNHLGILVMDEPRQQETKRPSFRELFVRASSALKAGQQVIIATSEEKSNLDSLLQGVTHQRIEVSTKKVLTRVASTQADQ